MLPAVLIQKGISHLAVSTIVLGILLGIAQSKWAAPYMTRF